MRACSCLERWRSVEGEQWLHEVWGTRLICSCYNDNEGMLVSRAVAQLQGWVEFPDGQGQSNCSWFSFADKRVPCR